MGGDLKNKHKWRDQQVSIHAPAWGATIVSCRISYRFFVSIHAPAWGATDIVSAI